MLYKRGFYLKKFVSLTLAALMMVTSAYGAGISVNLDN